MRKTGQGTLAVLLALAVLAGGALALLTRQNQKAEEAVRAAAERVGDGGLVADGGHRPLVEVAERALRLLAGRPPLDLVRGVPAALDGHLRHAGELVQAHHVADHVHLGVPGEREVGLHVDAAGAVDLRARLLGQEPAQRAGLHARRPHLGGRLDAADLPVAVLDRQAVGVEVGDHRAQLHLDADLVEVPAGAVAELLAELLLQLAVEFAGGGRRPGAAARRSRSRSSSGEGASAR